MEVEEIQIFPLRIPFKQPARIASWQYPCIESVLVKVKTDTDVIGYGEAVADTVFTGETMESIVSAIKNHLAPAVLGSNPFSLRQIHHRMDEALVRNTSAKAAIEMACLDAVGRETGQPLYNLLGGKFTSEIFMVPEIVFGSLNDVVKRCEEAVAMGAKCLKVKVGENPDKDVEKVKRIRKTIGDEVEIRLDANQGWRNYWVALKIIKRIERYDVSLIEQPLPYYDLSGTARLRKSISIPIMLDESIHNINDVRAALELEACDVVSVKIMKAGGLLRIKELVDFCSAHGMPCHMGTSWETEVGWAANLHLITALPGIQLWDAYSPTEIYWGATAAIADGIKTLLEKGVRLVKVPDGAGLGISVNEETVTRHLAFKPARLKRK